MINYILKASFPIFLFVFIIGCGGGGSSSNSNMVTQYLVDSSIKGVKYDCGTRNGITDINGKFTCEEDSSVVFSVGGIKLGSMSIDSNLTYVTPAHLYQLDIDNISDPKVLSFIRFVQSIDSDKNPSNGIDINETINESLENKYLDLDNSDTQTDLENLFTDINITLVSESKALEHYTGTLRDLLGVNLLDEPYYGLQWYLDYNESVYEEHGIDENAHIHFTKELQKYTGKGIKIAIIDDGLDTTHPELEDSIVNTYNVITGTDDVSHDSYGDYHGTAVTGIIASNINGKGIYGLANRSEIIFLKYRENMSDSETIELFNKAREFGADIINCSWGTYNVSQSVKDVIQDLTINGRDGKGTVIIFAVGNEDKDVGNDESAIPEVIAVGSTSKYNRQAWYSNHGDNIDILAPGGYSVGITTLDPFGSKGVGKKEDDYLLIDDSNSFIGTSASAPIVSASIALLLEKNPNLTASEVQSLLKNSADKVGRVEYVDGFNKYYGYGKLNLLNLLK